MSLCWLSSGPHGSLPGCLVLGIGFYSEPLAGSALALVKARAMDARGEAD
jgi:hypothetical protein